MISDHFTEKKNTNDKICNSFAIWGSTDKSIVRTSSDIY